jgi:hypothetical protein
MKRIGYILFIIICFGCSHKKVFIPYSKNTVISDMSGNPKDSSSYYFPEYLFDTVKNKNSKIWDLNVNSYLLFKMKEPVLSNFYLGRDIIRITALMSLSKPVLIRIDKYPGTTKFTVKRLNRNIRYPFMVLDTSASFTYDGEPVYQKKSEKDSLYRLYNNTDYFIEFEKDKILTKKEYAILSILIDSTQLWQTSPDLAQNVMQIDGSKWIVEAQRKFGYQIKVIPGPNFDRNYEYENEFDKKNHYRNLFEYVMILAGYKKEHLY